MVHRARAVWTPRGVLPDGVVVRDGDTITAVRPSQPGDPPALDGMLVPGLVNAHVHLELSHLWGVIPRGQGFFGWLEALFAARGMVPVDDAASTAARAMVAAGTVAVCDISTGGGTAPTLAAAGLVGAVQDELLTLDPSLQADRLAQAAAPARREGELVVRPSPHAPYSTTAPLIRAASRPDAVPASIHLAEIPGERTFLETGGGPFADAFDRLGLTWTAFEPPGCGPVDYLARLGVLGPDLLLVHGVDLRPDEWRQVAASGAPVCLCPRSNRYISGLLPDVPAALAAGVDLCLGTDSLASNEDLDVLGEVAALIDAFPDVPPGTWLDLATRGGAAALRLPLGEIRVGAAPGLVLLHHVTEPADLRVVPARTVLRAEAP